MVIISPYLIYFNMNMYVTSEILPCSQLIMSVTLCSFGLHYMYNVCININMTLAIVFYLRLNINMTLAVLFSMCMNINMTLAIVFFLTTSLHCKMTILTNNPSWACILLCINMKMVINVFNWFSTMVVKYKNRGISEMQEGLIVNNFKLLLTWS